MEGKTGFSKDLERNEIDGFGNFVCRSGTEACLGERRGNVPRPPPGRVGGRMMTREGSSPARAETPFARVAPGACAYSLARRDTPKLSTYDFMPAISIQGGSPMMSGTGAFGMLVTSGGSPKGPSMAFSIIALIRPYST